MAPVSNEAWSEINNEAKRVLTSLLSSRRFLNVEGPKGWSYSSVPQGRLDIPSGQKKEDVVYGIRKVQPLIEPRISFKLNIWELDNISRGGSDADLDPLTEAAEKLARFEEQSVYYGIKNSLLTGLAECNKEGQLDLPGNNEDFPATVSEGVARLMKASVKGPYALVVGPEKWKQISSFAKGYPLKKQLEKILGGPIIFSQFINEAFILPEEAEELRLILGQDISIGYESHTDKEVKLFLTESFTLKIDNPDSVITIK